MKQFNRYLIFFVIVAIGLVLSWGNVGRRTGDALREQAVTVLGVEDDCRPIERPCAAYGGDVAMVLGPVAGGMRLVVSGVEPGAELYLQPLSASGDPLRGMQAKPLGDDSWVFPSPTGETFLLTVELLVGDQRLSADFPLTDRR